MAAPPDRETRQLIDDLKARRARRRWTRVALIVVGAAVVLAAIITGAVLATAAPGNDASGSAPSSVAEVATTARAATTTTRHVATTTVTTKTMTTQTVTSATSPATDTTAGPTSTSLPATTTTGNRLAGKVIVIDPGHQAHADLGLEPIGPGSKTKKAKVSGGTSSVLTGISEGQVTLEVGLKLRDALKALGVTVVMIREAQNVDVTNIQRAQIANKVRADLTVRLHCNGSTDHSVHGLFTLYPASIKGWTDDIAATSKKAAAIFQHDLIAATNAQDRGLQVRSDLTGFNWSDVPVILVEMGFMTNPTEDKQLRSDAYQDKLVQGFVQGIIDSLKS
jgi:N-acetylmuramoyl-L-alanine amidase